jgi:hypothetical protein
VLQIGFGEGPLRELAAQEEAEAFAEDEAAGALAEFDAGAAAEIEEEELTFTASETFDGQGEPRVGGFGDGGEAAAPVACAVPRLKREARAADFERVVFGGEGKQFLTGFEEGGFTSAGEEALDLGAYGRQIAGDGGLHWANTASI